MSVYRSKRKRSRKSNSRSFIYRAVFAFLVIVFSVLIINISAKNTSASSNIQTERNKYYTCINIEPEDTLWTIAADYITDEYKDYYDYIAEVMNINNMIEDTIKSGDVLFVPYYSDLPREIA